MRVMVTGGAGYIGSVVTEELINEGHTVVVLDNFSKGSSKAIPAGTDSVHLDILDQSSVREALLRYRIDAVVHMAAFSQVGESVAKPDDYYRNNVSGTLSLLGAMQQCNVRHIVFSSTAAVYGEPTKQPIEETDRTAPTNPYGETKLAVENALRWYGAAYGIDHASLRYFNAAGATARYGEWHCPESHLIPLVLQTAAGRLEALDVFGEDYPTPDGTCIRDYVHVVDIARAHTLVLKSLHSNPSRVYNLGSGGAGYSVKQVVESAERVTGRSIPIRISPRRAGDPPVLIASSERIRRELAWKPQFQSLDEIIRSAWCWMQSHPEGYTTSE